MGTHASIVYGEEAWCLDSDGDPGCVIDGIREAVKESADAGRHRDTVFRSEMTEQFGRAENSAWASSSDEWYYDLEFNEVGLHVKIQHNEKEVFSGHIDNVPAEFPDPDEEE